MKTKKTVIEHLKDIVENCGRKSIKFEDGSMMVDLMTAKAVLLCYEAVPEHIKQKIEAATKTRNSFYKMASFCFSKCSIK